MSSHSRTASDQGQVHRAAGDVGRRAGVVRRGGHGVGHAVQRGLVPFGVLFGELALISSYMNCCWGIGPEAFDDHQVDAVRQRLRRPRPAFSATRLRTLGVRFMSSNFGASRRSGCAWKRARVYQRLAVVLDGNGAELGQGFTEGSGHGCFLSKSGENPQVTRRAKRQHLGRTPARSPSLGRALPCRAGVEPDHFDVFAQRAHLRLVDLHLARRAAGVVSALNDQHGARTSSA